MGPTRIVRCIMPAPATTAPSLRAPASLATATWSWLDAAVAQSLHLTHVISEVLPGARTYRVGPDRLPADTFVAASPIASVAYWYRNHAYCTVRRCRCWGFTDTGPGDVDFRGGDGIALVAYLDGSLGVYALWHAPDAPVLSWEQIARADRRFTVDEVARMREAFGGSAPRFAVDDTLTLSPERGADAIWMAYDAMMVDLACHHWVGAPSR